MKGKWSSGKIAALILGSMVAGMVLTASFYVSAYQLLARIGHAGDTVHMENGKYRQEDEGTGGFPGGFPGDLGEASEPGQEEEDKDKNSGQDTEYYEFHNEIKDDLSYQVRFETYVSSPGFRDNVSVKMEYPVVTGNDEATLKGVNDAIRRELEEVKVYGESVTEWISPGENFEFETECYVTYMDEEILSVIYLERGYLDDEVYESYVVSVNIDMESKMALTNSQLLQIDDEFSVDFRERCERQNGEIQFFSIYSDQDITDLLTDDDSLIIFYTPLGMEVGFNYYYGWVTVTYQDYQKYKSHI